MSQALVANAVPNKALARAGMIKHPFVGTEWNGIDVKSDNKSWIPSHRIWKLVCFAFSRERFLLFTHRLVLSSPTRDRCLVLDVQRHVLCELDHRGNPWKFTFDLGHAAWNGGIKTEHVDQFQTWRPPNFHFQIWIPHLNFDSTESISSEKCPTNDIKRDWNLYQT